MSHHIYHTRGLILGSVSIGESNKFYRIFTEELGLIGATAQAVREQKSKLRYSLQDFSWAMIDVVHGKEVWRITSALPEERGLREAGIPISFVRACALISRLVHGEGMNDRLFRELCAFAEFLEQYNISPSEEATIEGLMTLRILSCLGYIDNAPYIQFLETGVWNKDIIDQFEKIRHTVIPAINHALRSSHL